MKSIFLFHRDFRIIDNNSLEKLSKISDNIIPIFIFNPEQVDPSKNPYYNEKSIKFMIKCLYSIPKLQVFYGNTENVLESIFQKQKIDILSFNIDYTPYAKKRTKKVLFICKKYDVKTINSEDYTILPLNKYRKEGFYKVFKPFFDFLGTLEIPKVSKKIVKLSYTKLKIDIEYKFKLPTIHKKINMREKALFILKNKSKFKEYKNKRNFPIIETTHLSKYIKFGVVSIREVYYSFKNNIELSRQIAWHDFYACLIHFLPVKDTIGGGNIQHLSIKWNNNNKIFKAWCDGNTGYPIIDAGMRQLNETGWMHNRVRLITSNFLSLSLGINWKKGEKYFAQKLVDYDITSNNLNWQFSVQIGTDNSRFLRIYNPFLQSKKYDPECLYIKKWVKELEDVPNKDIHNWDKKYIYHNIDYPKPIEKNKLEFQ
jgi:deoxyribodipyrimidine photo-lyase